MTATRTPFQTPGESGMPSATVKVSSAATTGTTAVFMVQMPGEGDWMVSIIASSTAGGQKQGSAVGCVSWVRPLGGEVYRVGATTLHGSYGTNVTAIALGTPTTSGYLPVSVTFGAGETNGKVLAKFRRLTDDLDAVTLSRGGAITNDSAGPVAPLLADSFTRADNVSSLGSAESGQAWSALAGTWGVISGQAYQPSGASNSIAVIDLGYTDHFVQAKMANNGGNIGIVFRCTDANNFYQVQSSGGVINLQKRLAGSVTTVQGTGQSLADGDVLSAEIVGSRIVIRQNGTVRLTVTDTNLTSGTKVGLWNPSNYAGARWDDFLATTPTV